MKQFENDTMTNAEMASWFSFAMLLYMLLWNVLQS
jgi:hypothetical protein